MKKSAQNAHKLHCSPKQQCQSMTQAVTVKSSFMYRSPILCSSFVFHSHSITSLVGGMSSCDLLSLNFPSLV